MRDMRVCFRGKNFHKKVVGLCVLFGFVFALSSGIAALAQTGSPSPDGFGLQPLSQSGLASQDIRITVAKIIRAALGLLGVVALAIVIYGGYLFMTAAGNEQQAERGKMVLRNGLIGLGIILSSFAIVQFVISRLAVATGLITRQNLLCSDPEACSNPNFNCGGSRVCCSVGRFAVRSITPSGGQSTGMNNIVIRVVFSQDIATQTTADQVFVVKKDGAAVTENFDFAYVDPPARSVVEARPKNGAFAGFPAGHLPSGRYEVKVGDVKDYLGRPLDKSLSCGRFDDEAAFIVDTTGVVDAPPAGLLSLSPITINGAARGNDAPLARGATYLLESAITDDHGIGFARLRLERQVPGASPVTVYDGPPVSGGSAGPYGFSYPLALPSSLPPLERYIATLTGWDIDSNQRDASASFVIVGEHCANGVQDADETGIDTGGASCPKGPDDECAYDWQCGSYLCINNKCVAAPVITDVSPWDGAEGNFVTIFGRYFGANPGRVEFGAGSSWVLADLPQQCGANSWRNTSVVVSIPRDAQFPRNTKAPVRVIRADNPSLRDTSNDNRGPKGGPDAGLFTKNDIRRPGLCAVETPSGGRAAPPGAVVIARGNNFSGVPNGDIISFGAIPSVIDQATLSPNQFSSKVPPNMLSGVAAVTVKTGSETSNAVPFTILAVGEDTIPVIESIDPGSATPESIVTIRGRRFGSDIGFVYLAKQGVPLPCRPTEPRCVQAEASLPAFCVNSWTDTQIMVRLPGAAALLSGGVASSQYRVVVQNALTGAQSDGSQSIEVQVGSARPGICSLSPTIGPGVGQVILRGFNFSNDPTIYFFTRGSLALSQPNALSTWLSVVSRDISGNRTTELIADIPARGMETGPIRVANRDGVLSNPALYTLQDCRAPGLQPPASPPGLQCCTEGPDAGRWKLSCAGASEGAGYVWRFTTGKISDLPSVVEACEAERWPNTTVVPSPTPWDKHPEGTNTCLNATIAVQFSMDMDAATAVNRNNVKFFTCGSKEAPACDGGGARDVSNLLAPSYSNRLLKILEPNASSAVLESDTWYRVALFDEIRSLQIIEVLGTQEARREPLQKTRPCRVDGREAAYCFEFKTRRAGPNQLCQIAGAAINPSAHSVKYLGPLVDPSSPPGRRDPFYYLLWGIADQKCAMLNADNAGWRWSTSDSSKATVQVAPGEPPPPVDSRATGEAVGSTVSGNPPIDAPVDVVAENFPQAARRIRAISKLTIDADVPQVELYWPNCEVACVNAEIGARFSIPMYTPDYRDGALRLFKCQTASCYTTSVGGQVQLDTAPASAVVNRVPLEVETGVQANDREITGVLGAGSRLEPNTWYQAEIDGVRAIGSYIGISPRPGRSLVKTFIWTFKTKDDGSLCAAAQALVQPQAHVATEVGEKTVYRSIPVGSPDECNPRGQRLNPWDYGWSWGVRDDVPPPDLPNSHVAVVSRFSSLPHLKSFCTRACLPGGSTTARPANPADSPVRFCGNNHIDPGEDCEISGNIPGTTIAESAGVSCSFNCLRPGSAPPDCGNGNLEKQKGEECDDGNARSGDGCSNRCLNEGTPPVQAGTRPAGGYYCGGGLTALVDLGEDCEIGLAPSGGQPSETTETCSASCLHLGTPLTQGWCDANGERTIGSGSNAPKAKDTVACRVSVSVCGNDILESGEECEVRSDQVYVRNSANPTDVAGTATGIPAGACGSRCLLLSAMHADVPAYLRCDAGSAGCGSERNLQGSSVMYPEPSLCGDGVLGAGESALCEYASAEVQTLRRDNGLQTLNPVQVVTAKGEGQTDMATRSQLAHVDVTLRSSVAYIGPVASYATAPFALDSGDYALQCGFTEFDAPQTIPLNPPVNGQSSILKFNDCSNNADNLLGVGVNSCCYPRPVKIASYPADGASNVCRNTALWVEFRGRIDETSLAQNIILARGIKSNENCSSGEREETTLIAPQLLSQSEAGFWRRVLERVREFFSFIAGERVAAITRRNFAVQENVAKWCVGVPALTAEAPVYEEDAATRVVTTRAALNLSGALEGGRVYVVYLKGGKTGIRDERGVGMVNEIIIFKTKVETNPGDGICRIDSVQADPAQHTFTRPNTGTDIPPHNTRNFTAKALTSDRQEIQPLSGVYDWQWAWGPQTSPPPASFAIPDVRTSANTIKSKNVEGEIEAFVSARVTADSAGSPSTVGHARIAPIKLTAFFCERPWPAYYPYQDAPGNKDNHTGLSFDGADIPPVALGGNPVYFNMSMGYCADAGRSGVTTDDLPYLRPLLGIRPPDGSLATPASPADVAATLENGFQRGTTGSATGRGSNNLAYAFNGTAGGKFARADDMPGQTWSYAFWFRTSQNPFPNFIGRQFTDRLGWTVHLTGSRSLARDKGYLAIRIDTDPTPNTPNHNQVYSLPDVAVNDDAWHFAVVMMRSGASDGKVWLSLDGASVQDFTYRGGFPAPRGGEMRVGGAIVGSNAYVGLMDDIQIYDRLLRPVEIDYLYRVSPPGLCFTTNVPAGCSAQRPGLVVYLTADPPPSSASSAPGPRQLQILSGALKEWLFFSNKSDDAIGLRVFANTERLSAREWYRRKFGDPPPEMRSVVIDGMEAITDGETYYINALNVPDVAARQVYNNIAVLSVNPDAQPETKQVFNKLAQSLKFTTNLTNYGVCALGGDKLVHMQSPDNNYNNSGKAVICNNDLDCPLVGDQPRICSNERAKLRRDLRRLRDIVAAQTQLASYRAVNGSYPNLASGSYLPAYTNSRWPSWGSRLGAQAGGGLNMDPVNLWATSSCGICAGSVYDQAVGITLCSANVACNPGGGNANTCRFLDPQTCWDPGRRIFICPARMQAYEYKTDAGGSNYRFHAPLEYLLFSSQIVGELTMPTVFGDRPHYDEFPSCAPGAAAGVRPPACGDGVVAPDEVCEPGQSSVQPEGYADGQCQYPPGGPSTSCTLIAQCPKSVFTAATTGAYIAKPRSATVCLWKNRIIYRNTNAPAADSQADTYECQTRAQCVTALTGNANWSSRTLGATTPPTPAGRGAQDLSSPDLTCGAIGSAVGFVNDAPVVCGGVGAIRACPNNGRATQECTAQCAWRAGICESACGNGVRDAGEDCDDGALNGTYGHCPRSCRTGGATAGSCGNNEIEAGGQEVCDPFIVNTLRRLNPGFCLKTSCKDGRYAFGAAQLIAPSANIDISLARVFSSGAQNWWAVGSSYDGISRRRNGVIYRFSGGTWQRQFATPAGDGDAEFRDVLFVDAQNGYAAGRQTLSVAQNFPLLYKTADGGVRWTKVIIPQNQFTDVAGGGAGLNSVYFFNATTGWAAGDNGLLMKTANGGAGWERMEQMDGGAEDLLQITFVGQDFGWVLRADNIVRRTQNGGATWNSGSANYVGASNAWIVRRIAFTDSSRGWAAAGWRIGAGAAAHLPNQNGLWKTVDGGATWNRETGAATNGPNEDFVDVKFIDQYAGFVLGKNGSLFSTVNGGASWARQRNQAPAFPPQEYRALALARDGESARGWMAGVQSGDKGLMAEIQPSPYCAGASVDACGASSQCQFGDSCVGAGDASYYPSQNRAAWLASPITALSCALDCRVFGDYCGDGAVQTGADPVRPYEECDDGKDRNGTPGSSCDARCLLKTRALSTAQASGGVCGDGAVQTGRGEVCDLGDDNGLACSPTYDRACTYCAADCGRILTVEPTAYCGSGAIDEVGVDARGRQTHEQCDERNGVVVVFDQAKADADPPVLPPQRTLSCNQLVTDANQQMAVGAYHCAQSCLDPVVNQCVVCGVVSPGNAAQVAVVNPMLGDAPKTSISVAADEWRSEMRMRLSLNRTDLTPPGPRLIGPAPDTQLAQNFFEPQRISLGNNRGLETNTSCKYVYGIRFYFGDADRFSYPVTGERPAVTNEYVVSPPVPPGAYRIVVRWKDTDAGNTGAEFIGSLYNEAFTLAGGSFPKVINLLRARTDTRPGAAPSANQVCEDISKHMFGSDEYWWPTGCTGYENDNVFVHPQGTLAHLRTQAITVLSGGGSVAAANGNSNNTLNTNYAFYVEPDIGVSMNSFRNRDIMVEVYEARNGQDSLKSVYKPWHTFNLRHALAGLSGSRYWHVFNLVRQPGGQYAIAPFGGSDADGLRHGSLEQTLPDIVANIPRQ